MSQENIEIVRRGFEAWNAGDVDALRALYDPAIIMRAPPNWPEPGPFVGREAVMRQFSDMRDAFDNDSFQTLSDFLPSGDRVIVRADWRTIGRGPQGDVEMTVVFTVRRGLVFNLEFFWDHDEALAAAGLSV
jgi:ketosteroid isomerase-like protein